MTFTIWQTISGVRDSKTEQQKSSETTRNCTLSRKCGTLTFWLIDPNESGHSEQWWKPSVATLNCSRPIQHDNLTFWFGNSYNLCRGDSYIISKRNAQIWLTFKGRQEAGIQNCIAPFQHLHLETEDLLFLITVN